MLSRVSSSHPRILRHRRVTTWLAEGKNPIHVKEALGHADLATTMGYTHLAKEHATLCTYFSINLQGLLYA